MTTVVIMPRPQWPQWLRRKPLAPSPIPEAARETKEIAQEVTLVVADLRKLNDVREAKLR